MSRELMDSTAEKIAPHLVPRLPNEILVGESQVQIGRFVAWDVYSHGVYRCDVALEADGSGGYSVYVPRLPGVVSEGDTETHALENIREALAAALETYLADGQPIPWIEAEPAESSSTRRWVVVHV